MKHRFPQEVTPAFIQRCPSLGFMETSAEQEAVAPVTWNTVCRGGQMKDGDNEAFCLNGAAMGLGRLGWRHSLVCCLACGKLQSYC